MNKKQIGLNIRKRRLELNLVQGNIAQAIKVKPSYITRIENGQANVTIDKLIDISQFLKIPLHALFSNEPLVPRAEAIKDPLVIEVFSDEAAKLEYDKYRTQDDFVAVRILESELSLGPGVEIYSAETEGYALIYKDVLTKRKWNQTRENERFLCFKVKGNSMAPTINNDSMVVIDVQDTKPQKNKIYAFWLEDKNVVTVKRLANFDKKVLILEADNPNEMGYPIAIEAKRQEDDPGNPIRGRIVWTWNVL